MDRTGLPIHPRMALPSPHRLVLSHAGPDAYAPMTRVILAKLGYLILRPEELAAIEGSEDLRPVLVLLDECQVAAFRADDPAIPILVVAGEDGEKPTDPRVAGVVKRPADTRALYRLIQQLTEKTPRAVARVATELTARCRRGPEQWLAVVRSISEYGCLLSSVEPLELGCRIELSFELPDSGRLALAAETVYQASSELGMVFPDIGEADRLAIAHFVTQTLFH